MPAPGTRLGAYEIVSPLGAGGMGAVYRARDTRLGRDVAIKVLPPEFVSDPERVARFQREAHVLAALNHPHIAQIYGFEDVGRDLLSGSANRAEHVGRDPRSGPATFLVMELVDGETLDQRIARGPIPVDEALAIAKQIAEALEAAHEKGIIHRDLKPSNIALTKDGAVKVLDFGLAKLTEASGSGLHAPGAMSMSPTITSPALVTGVGVLLGTAAYMSPEQAKGKEADKRSDIWSFGVIVFEMLTGRSPFSGETVSETLAYVITRDADVGAVAAAPSSVKDLLRRCLVKDPYRRIRDIGDVRLALDDIQGGTGVGAESTTSPRRLTSLLPWAVAAAAVMAAAALGAMRAASPLTNALLMWVSVDLGGDAMLRTDVGRNLALSRNGSMVAFAGSRRGDSRTGLFVRRLSELQPTLLPDTEDAHDPFFSPDGRTLAFFSDGTLKVIDLPSGVPHPVSPSRVNGAGGFWRSDGTIVTGGMGPGVPLNLWSVAKRTVGPFSTLMPGELNHRFPHFLDSGDVIFTAAYGSYTATNVVVQRPGAGPAKTLVTDAVGAVYVPSGHLLYVQTGERGSLFAAPFDARSLEVTGPAVRLTDNVASGFSGAPLLALSGNGVLAYAQGPGWTGQQYLISWLDGHGRREPLIGTPGNYAGLSFSPDGRRVAVTSMDNAGDIWIADIERSVLTRLTFDPAEDRNPVWSPDGQRVVFASRRGDDVTPGRQPNLWTQRADGNGEAQRLTDTRDGHYPTSWHPSGAVIAFNANHEGNVDVMMLPMTGSEATGWKSGRAYSFISTPFQEGEAAFSPDGRWLAYASDESGRLEIYVRPFPGPGAKVQVSAAGGSYPTWSNSGRLFYVGDDRRLWSARYHTGNDAFTVDKPSPWSAGTLIQRPAPSVRSYEVQPGTERVAALDVPSANGAIRGDRIVLMVNLLNYLRQVAPPAK